MRAINMDNIHIKNERDRSKLLNNLKSSYDTINSSPVQKISPINNDYVSHRNKNDEVFRGKGKRLYNQNQNSIDSVKFDYKDYYLTPNDRINQILDYYAILDRQRGRSLDHNHNLHHQKEIKQIKDNKNKMNLNRDKNRNRQNNLSPENPHNKSVDSNGQKEDYFVMKFNYNAMSNLNSVLGKNKNKLVKK
jgi:hypothetical protein